MGRHKGSGRGDVYFIRNFKIYEDNVKKGCVPWLPDKVKAPVNLSVPFAPQNPEMNSVEWFWKLYGDDHCIYRFQEHGEIEVVFVGVGTKEVLKNILSFRDPGPLFFPKGKGFTYSIDRAPLLKEEDLDYYVNKFEKTGFIEGVNYYRAIGL